MSDAGSPGRYPGSLKRREDGVVRCFRNYGSYSFNRVGDWGIEKMMIHELKTLPEPFKNVRQGKKKAEIRFDDRDYRIGDVLVLKEWKLRKKEFTGREYRATISDITRIGHWIPNIDHRWVVLHMEPEVE